MKTIKEASKEYLNNSLQTKAFLNVNYEENNYEAGYNDSLINNIEEAFKAGAEFGVELAQEWISVKITPEWYTGSRLDILVKNETFKYPASVKIHTICSDKDVQELKAMFTHWRYLELK